ncbi:MAG: HlyD family efflux transporter periplasmic adaptor subunit [Planctomycetes bacterium]|nr:HlyD family efflux transporter periplasmic adaptor subunit [Planctomycetota bacterium]MCR4318232.1 HlyD family efflux transporter periplasmic adaptor subunit [Planctomycetota bacterium]
MLQKIIGLRGSISFRALRTIAAADLRSIVRSKLCWGFFIVSALLTTLTLKGMQTGEEPAIRMLEAVYGTYIIIWMHAVIFIAGSALMRESDCLMEGILSRGITRGEYIAGKLVARSIAILFVVGGVLLPAGFWAIRQDALTRTDTGFVASNEWNTKVEAHDPQQLYSGAEGNIIEMKVKNGDQVDAGQVLILLDDRRLFDDLEWKRRDQENARQEVENAERRVEDAERAVVAAEETLTQSRREFEAARANTVGVSENDRAKLEDAVNGRERDLETARNRVPLETASVDRAQRAHDVASDQVRQARERLTHAVVVSPISGHLIETKVQSGQWVAQGTHLLTVAPLSEFELHVPVYDFEDFQRLKEGLTAYVTVEDTEFIGKVERVGATTEPDKWQRPTNFAVVRFSSNGARGLLGLGAEVKIALPPPEEDRTMADEIFDTLTGRGKDDLDTRTASVTYFWMLVGFAKVIGCAMLLVTLSLFATALFRSALFSILGVVGLWHVSNLLFDFAGLPELSYIEIMGTMDKVLAGASGAGDEIAALCWLYGISAVLGVLTVYVFTKRDPVK